MVKASGRIPCSHWVHVRKGNLWETIAVPELRVQIAELAGLLTAQLKLKVAESAILAFGP